MDFGLSDDQETLKKAAREFIEAEIPMTVVRKVAGSESGFDPELWKAMADLGWMGIAIPESAGGLGLGLLELVLLLEEMARGVVPAPFYSTVALAAPVVTALAADPLRSDFLQRVGTGDVRATVALTEAEGRWDAQGVNAGASRTDKGWKLEGKKMFVPDAHLADEIVVLARTAKSKNPEEGISAFLVPAADVAVTQHKTLDATRRLGDVDLGGVVLGADRCIGPEGGAWPIITAALDRAAVALAAEAVGAADAALGVSVAYAKERQQFGRPIGTYQAISHKCADMLLHTESGRSHAYYAAWALDAGVPDAKLAAARAKVMAGDGAVNVVKDGIQIHAGIGFTWEHDLHFYYRRAKWCQMFLGSGDVWRERVTTLLESQ